MARILDWTVNELKDIDRKTRKLMTMNHVLHSKVMRTGCMLAGTMGKRNDDQLKNV